MENNRQITDTQYPIQPYKSTQLKQKANSNHHCAIIKNQIAGYYTTTLIK